MIIYKITNLINGKFYIGQTVGKLEYRWKKHQKDSSRCSAIYAAIKKYGADSFSITVLETCKSRKELNERESFYIESFSSMSPNGYNLLGGGNSRIMSSETKLKLSIANSGEKNPHYGKPRPKHVKDAISKKAKSRGSAGTFSAVESTKKAIICIETGVVYDSVSDASRFLDNVGVSNICRVLKGKLKHIKGLTFKYVENP